jgi:large subunit ribosomal protein L3
MKGILGKKLGMTQIYKDDGTAVPVTVVQAGPCMVTQVKTAETDGYEAVQIGLVEDRPPRNTTKAMTGHFEKAGVAPVRTLMEFEADGEEVAAGDQVKCSIFEENEYVDIIGKGKGKGFQGVIKRHGFGGGRASHGSMFHRAPGSIGQSAWPSRVYPGTRLPGHMGAHRLTVKNLQVVKVDEENNLLYIKGAVPGGKNALVGIQRAKRG